MTNSYIKNKKTGEIRYVCSRCSDGSLECIDKNGIYHKMSFNENSRPYWNSAPKGWELTQFDYEKLIPNVLDFCNQSGEARKIFNILARRTDPDYFDVGIVVRIVDSYYFDLDQNNYRQEANPFVIKEIRLGSDRYNDVDIYRVFLSPLGSEEKIIEIPLYLNRLIPHDAFHALQRFDKPY